MKTVLRLLPLLVLLVTGSFAVFAYETPADCRYPYVSTYYVQPVVKTGETVEIGFFVTDWDNSLVRFGDDSHRFSAFLRYSSDNTHWTSLQMTDLHSGDHVFQLGQLPAGDYVAGIRVEDENGVSSHTVWHEFRVRDAADLVIPEAKIWHVSGGDLARYGIVAESGRYSFETVEISAATKALSGNDQLAAASNECAAAAAAAAPASGTYTIFAPSNGGKLMYKGWKMAVVAYAADYDFAAVETESATNTVAIQRLLDDAVQNGFSKVVWPQGVYRVSGYSSITVPGGLTVDLNGATIKMNRCTGSKGNVFVMTHAHDAHLVNGIVEGDYYEHDYIGSPNSSEWVCGISLEGDCEYCSLENLTVRCITGYGVSNGTRAYDHTFDSTVKPGSFAAGKLRLTDGTVVTRNVPYRYTSGYTDISKLTHGYVMVSKYLGYQGIATKSWYYLAAFYDSRKRFISGEVAFQYRNIPIPAGAKYMRVTVETETLDDAKNSGLSAQHFKLPWNCAYKGLVIDRCRAVGMAPSAMRNMLIEDCDFSFSGDTLATCAFDAEDGWDMMQDVYIHRNTFHDNPNSELLTCAGHNFIIEDNVAKLHLYARTCCPCVRNNTAPSAKFYCDTSRNRTMHGRYENNRYGTSVTFGGSNTDIGWDICSSQDLVSYIDGQELTISPSQTGRIRDCTVEHGYIFNSIATFDNVIFSNVHFVETQGANNFRSCQLLGCYLQHHNKTNGYENCVFRNTNLSIMSGGTMLMTNTVFYETYFEPSYWAKPITLDMYNCAVTNSNKFFFRPAVYTIGNINAVNCDFNTGTSPAFDIFDMRAQDTDVLDGKVTISCSSCSSGGFLKKGTGTLTSTKHVDFISSWNFYNGALVTPEKFLNALYGSCWTRTMIPGELGIHPGETLEIPVLRADWFAAIEPCVAILLSTSDRSAGLSTSSLKTVSEAVANGWKMTVDINREHVEGVTGPIGVDASAEPAMLVESTVEGTVVSATVRTVPGLWYGFMISDSLSPADFRIDPGSFRRADTSGRLRITSSALQRDSAFFKVCAKVVKPE